MPTTSATNQTNPIEHLFDNGEFSLITEIQTWKSVVAHYQNKVKRVQEQSSQAIFDYIEQVDILQLSYAKQQLKVERLEGQLLELKTNKE